MEEVKYIIDQLIKKEDIKLDEIPKIDLYMDQVLTLFDEYFPYDETEQKVTKTMINNYAKGGIIKPAAKKKYNREHILTIIIVCILKRSMSLAEIKELMDECATDDDIEKVYSSFLKNKLSMNDRVKVKIEDIVDTFIERNEGDYDSKVDALDKDDVVNENSRKEIENDETIRREDKLMTVLMLSYYSNLLGEVARILVRNNNENKINIDEKNNEEK
ncbi:DUF1836 domain-containing protein [Peptostreptococcus equinus]|uniref:DUF1836 domain-containing protein n=1 Tax=Peptostreptococcus equinus TaxID=3003601 RepID=A0ABY7JRB0_9FIRM|nr:DUF1836 domain-containing protein [Peptostreptococcus sp. CBA3647]WAW15031.1 DUF1836 domain-containing protein [Peptostreptococcus sp. CBA3647]